jgi:hypothetical protein
VLLFFAQSCQASVVEVKKLNKPVKVIRQTKKQAAMQAHIATQFLKKQPERKASQTAMKRTTAPSAGDHSAPINGIPEEESSDDEVAPPATDGGHKPSDRVGVQEKLIEDLFHSTISSFLESIAPHVEEAQQGLDNAVIEFQNFARAFGENPAQTTPEELLGIFFHFSQDLLAAHNENFIRLNKNKKPIRKFFGSKLINQFSC